MVIEYRLREQPTCMEEDVIERSPDDDVRQSEIAADVLSLFLRAQSAMELRNWPYAINLLHSALSQEPGFLDGRKVLRLAAIKNSAERRGLKLGGESIKIMRLHGQLATNPLAVIEGVEKEVLADDPHSIPANELLFEAAVAAGMPKTAGFALETILEVDPGNVLLYHRLGDYYFESGAYGEAVQIFEKAVRRDRTDLAAARKLKDATACRTMETQKWAEDTDWRELITDCGDGKEVDTALRQGATPEMLQARADQLAAELAHKGPGVEVTQELAETYERLRQYDLALPIYETTLQLRGNDPALEKKVSEIREIVHANRLEKLRRYVEENPNSSDVAKYREEIQLEEEAHWKRRIDEAMILVERNPTDLELRLELGLRLYEAGRYKRAIRHLQKVRKSPNLRIRGIKLLGQCYAGKNMYDLAIKQFERAIAEVQETSELKLDLLYNLGKLYRKLGEKEKYLEAFKKIYDADCDFRDGEVANCVEESYDGQAEPWSR